ncbi:CAP domain-containing protein [Streptomyces termitum]|uniref:SCP domain-containing protein n=1 Tax=Streptomyces termitum TaxID=67368 RepID=A0A918WB80_9ACTN|nr:CAP domain-containing protein [Streptomyces termitum]GHA86512.1 hypothetical protein GCM10010305_32950 [Streptomyces termitum]
MRYDGPPGPIERSPARPAPGRRRAFFRTAPFRTGAGAAALTVLLGLYAAAAPPSPSPAPAADAVVAPRAAAGGGGPAAQTGGVRAVPAAGQDRASRYVRDVIALVNAEREKAGCGPLRTEKRLRRAAQAHADDMAARDYYAHDTPEGRDGGDRITATGYGWSRWGENIHKGPATPERAMRDWMGSPSHRANILDCAFRDVGAGVALTADGPWWVQDFGARR